MARLYETGMSLNDWPRRFDWPHSNAIERRDRRHEAAPTTVANQIVSQSELGSNVQSHPETWWPGLTGAE